MEPNPAEKQRRTKIVTPDSQTTRQDVEPPNRKHFLPDALKNEPAELKLVYRYIRKCQNASTQELVEEVGVSEEYVKSSLVRLVHTGFIEPIEESENRYAIND